MTYKEVLKKIAKGPVSLGGAKKDLRSGFKNPYVQSAAKAPVRFTGSAATDGLDRNPQNWKRIGYGRFRHKVTGQEYTSQLDAPPDKNVRVTSTKGF